MHRRINGRDGAGWVTVAGAAMLAACQPAATPADTAATANDAAVGAEVRPTTEAMPAERPLGTFATQEEALAAARQAGLSPGTGASATIGGEKMGIVRDGDTYVLVESAPKAQSGRPQRPPLKAEVVEP